MTKEDQSLDENEESTPVEESESEDTSEDLESLFDDDQEDAQEDAPVSRDELKRLEKGIQKLAAEMGRKKEPKQAEEKTEEAPKANSVLKSLYLKANPEANLVWDEVESEAKKLGKDPYELYEYSSYFKGEAKAKAEAKRIEEENKTKISKPESGVPSDSKTDVSKIKPEDVSKLKPADKIKWLKAQAEKERNDTD